MTYSAPLIVLTAMAFNARGGKNTAVDLMLGGSQKAFSAPPGMSIVAVSEQAWDIIDRVDYPGYDALKPFKTAPDMAYFPYTPYWHGLAALYAGTQILLKEGLENSFARHAAVAEECRAGIRAIGLQTFPAPSAVPAPTVTAVKVPEGITWGEFDRRLREHGLAVGGSYGPLAGKVFRLGHMGSQANHELLEKALDVLRQVCADLH